MFNSGEESRNVGTAENEKKKKTKTKQQGGAAGRFQVDFFLQAPFARIEGDVLGHVASV